jgi:hypothetical protein
MLCPNCTTAMREVTKSGVLIDVCPDCKGTGLTAVNSKKFSTVHVRWNRNGKRSELSIHGLGASMMTMIIMSVATIATGHTERNVGRKFSIFLIRERGSLLSLFAARHSEVSCCGYRGNRSTSKRDEVSTSSSASEVVGKPPPTP